MILWLYDSTKLLKYLCSSSFLGVAVCVETLAEVALRVHSITIIIIIMDFIPDLEYMIAVLWEGRTEQEQKEI